MSPERYIAVIGSGGVGLCRRHGREQQWLGSVGFISDPQTAGSVALDTLERLLAQHAPRRAELCVVLSSQYSRYGLVPWSEQIHSPAELLAYAQVCFEERYGVAGQDWRLTLSPEAAGHDRIAVALPQALLQRLDAIAEARGLKLVSVQPYLMAAYNRFGRKLDQNNFLFVVAEPSRSVLLMARAGRWVSVHSVGGNDSDAALSAMIAREVVLLASQHDQPLGVFLHAPGRLDSPPQIAGVQLCSLAVEQEPVRDVLFVMSRAVA
nr:hypothetical protein [Pseudomonas sp. R5(2019)]